MSRWPQCYNIIELLMWRAILGINIYTDYPKVIGSGTNQWKWYYTYRNDRWFAHLHIQIGGSKRIWILTYSWTGNFLLAWAGQFSGIKNQTMHRFEQYIKMLQLCHENSRFPPSFKFWSVSAIQKALRRSEKMHPARFSRPKSTGARCVRKKINLTRRLKKMGASEFAPL
jgi:hypothetical protein